ncbi:unnamed protein product [Heligmosomoides polygyrus]|uniref:Reverse transcriptase domain-containing protein n=1 Tax=Heligmosomoides polygyrus TaxID=6339 RepID=A0A183G0L5_HELPZ|nr:unnamed protein product [Heligmosomoides polygyrus]
MEDTIRELQRRISSKSEETTNEWESRKLRQRNEQAVTLTRQLNAVVMQNEELREEVTRVGDALEEATRIINESASRYAELTALHDATRHDLRALTEENAVMREKLEASSSMLMAAESEAMGTEQSAAVRLEPMAEAKITELSEVNRELRDELYAAQRELDKLRQFTESMNYAEKESELEKLRAELIEATRTARSLYGEMTSKSSTDPTVAFQLRIMQLEKHLEQSNDRIMVVVNAAWIFREIQIASQKKAIEELEETVVAKDEANSQLSAELERMSQMRFGDAREELKRLSTQLSFRDTQIAQLTNHCTMLQIELGNYAERALKPHQKAALVVTKTAEIQTLNGPQPDVVPEQERPRLESKKPRKSSKSRPRTEAAPATAEMTPETRRDFSEDVWEQQAMLIASLYSELMFILEAAFEEIYELRKNETSTASVSSETDASSELMELRRFASSIRFGGSELERKAEETTRKLIGEQIEKLRVSRSNNILRRRCARAEHVVRRTRERMVAVETQAGKRTAQLQYQLDTALIELANCQSQLVRSVPMERYEKLALRLKKECVAEALGSDLDEVWRENVASLAPTTDVKKEELEAKNAYLKKIVDVLSEQNDFWSKETEILQNENDELKRFVEDLENESDLKNILASIEQRLLETIREQQEGKRDHERGYRKAREAEESLAKGRREWAAERTRFIFIIRTLQSALSSTRMNSLGGLSLQQMEKLKTKIREIREDEQYVNESKSKIESLQTELEQQLAVQKSMRKARETVEEENAVVAKLERRMQSVYSSLELQTMSVDRLQKTVSLRDRQISELKDELDEVQKENDQLLMTLASSSLLGKATADRKKDSETNISTAIPLSPKSQTADESPSWREESEASSLDSGDAVVKTILHDNSKDFEKQLARMKEAAEICIQSYKKQLIQKEEALRIFRELAEEKLATSSSPVVEKEIIREEIRVKDEETEERLKQSLGDVARLKEELEELEKANRALYRKRRQSVVPAQSTVECQTEPRPDEDASARKEGKDERKNPREISPEVDVTLDWEKKLMTERGRHKNEVKQLQARLRRAEANNKELIITCEKIREDALAEMELRAPRIKQLDQQSMLAIRMDFEKARAENRALQRTVEEQRQALDNLRKASQQRKNPETEISKWNERKKLEENLSSVREKLAAAYEREKDLNGRLEKRERLLAELREDAELRTKELDRCQRRVAQLQLDRDKAVKEAEETSELKKRLKEQKKEMDEQSKDGCVLPSVLPSEIRHAISSMKKRTAPGPDRIRSERRPEEPPANAHYHPGAALHTLPVGVQGSFPVEDQQDRLAVQEGRRTQHWQVSPICLLSVVYMLFTRVILNRTSRMLDEGQPYEQVGEDSARSSTHTPLRSSRESKLPCLTFIDLKKAFDSVETEAVVEALLTHGVPIRYIREVETLSAQLRRLEEEHSNLKAEYGRMRSELEAASGRRSQRTENPGSTRALTVNKAVEVRGDQLPQPRIVVATDETLVFQLRETKNHMQKMGARLMELDEKLANSESDRQRLIDANKRLMQKIDQCSGPPGAVNVLCDKLEAKNREIAQLKSLIRNLELKSVR